MVIEDMNRTQLILSKLVLETRILNLKEYLKRKDKFYNKTQPKKFKGIIDGEPPYLSEEEVNYEIKLYEIKIKEINTLLKNYKLQKINIKEINTSDNEFRPTTLSDFINKWEE